MDMDILTSQFYQALYTGLFAGLILGLTAGLMGFAIEFLFNKVRKIS